MRRNTLLKGRRDAHGAGGRIRSSAQAAVVDGQRVYGVSVYYDALMNRLVPIGSLPRGIDRGWAVPAEPHPLGHIIAHGTIPEELCSAWPGPPSLRGISSGNPSRG